MTKFSGTSPPVHCRDLARRRGRPHVTSGYSCVKSGTCFGRAHSRVSHASTHAPFIIGTASKRMPKAAKFCCVYTYYVALSAQTRVPLSSTNFALSSEITVKNRQCFSNGAREDASPSKKQTFFFLARIKPETFLRWIGVFCMTRVKI